MTSAIVKQIVSSDVVPLYYAVWLKAFEWLQMWLWDSV